MKVDTISTANQRTTPDSTTWYYYNVAGNPTRIVTEFDAAPGEYSATRFEYAWNGQAVTYVVGETWNEDDGDVDNCPEDYTITFAREFRYDSGRARYLNREFDADELNEKEQPLVVISETWTDYDEADVYGDFEISGGAVVESRSFNPGLAIVDPWADDGQKGPKSMLTPCVSMAPGRRGNDCKANGSQRIVGANECACRRPVRTTPNPDLRNRYLPPRERKHR